MKSGKSPKSLLENFIPSLWNWVMWHFSTQIRVLGTGLSHDMFCKALGEDPKLATQVLRRNPSTLREAYEIVKEEIGLEEFQKRKGI